MSKTKTLFFCRNCGASAPKWIGKCPSCGEWNTYEEEVISKPSTAHDKENWAGLQGADHPQGLVKVTDVGQTHEQRLKLHDDELNRVLGGGVVPGSLVLLGGEPGIGKSTLLLQAALRMNATVLYVSGEESLRQIRMRAERIGIQNENCYLLAETDIQELFKEVKKLKPDVLIVDSIQTLYSKLIDSTPGSISQIRETTAELMKFAKQSNTPVFIIGHITKEGSIAGPKILEHMVDTVLQFEGDRHHNYRIVRSLKNRFGSAAELGIYEMQGDGLREVSNPSEILITRRDEALSGVSITAALEGLRPLFIETQALVSTAVYGNPQRNANGYDLRRLNMLLAVLEKRCGYFLNTNDVFVNIAGGLRLDDPAIDLGVAVSVIGSLENMAIPQETCFAGELGLSGEVRAVQKLEQRIAEAEKLGFSAMVISAYNTGINYKGKMELVRVNRIDQALTYLFG